MHKSTAAGKCIIGRNSDSDSIMLFRVGILDKRFYLPLIIGIIETQRKYVNRSRARNIVIFCKSRPFSFTTGVTGSEHILSRVGCGGRNRDPPHRQVEVIWASVAVYHWRQRAKNAQRPARRKYPVDVIGNPVREVVRIAGCQEARPVQAASAAGRFQTGPAGQPFLNGCPGRPATFTRML